MASRHEIVTIDFRANAGKANPAIESLRKSAEDANKRITELRANLEKGGTDDQIEKWNEEITSLDKKVEKLKTAEQTLIKGVGTLNQAIEAFNNGSLEQMSAKFQKTARNAAELQKQQLNPKSDTYKKDLADLDALTTRLDENMAKMKLHTDDLIATIEAGGKVSKSEITQEIKGIEELMTLIPHATDEWKKYNDQVTKLKDAATAMRKVELQDKSSILGSADLGQFSEEKIREAISAGKELISLYDTGDDKAKELARDIVDAEEHIKKYGVEAERASRKEAAAIEAEAEKQRKVIEQGQEALRKAQAGEYATSGMADLTTAIRQIKEYQALINDPKGTGSETFLAAKEQVDSLSSRLAELKGEAEKVKTGFANADEAITAFNRHMNEAPTERVITQAETLAKTESERLKQALDETTAAIDQQEKELDQYDKDIEESIERVQKLENELDKINQGQMKRRNALGKFLGITAEDDEERAEAMRDAHTVGKWTPWARREERRKKEIQGELEGDGYDAMGAKQRIEFRKADKRFAEENLQLLREEQAARRKAYDEAIANEERLRAAEQERFEQSQQGQRMTREQMQEAIKTIEDEALTVDRATEEGQKRWEGMRETIDAMSRELKEASGEWMSLEQAEKLAATAGGKDFVGTQQQLSQATAALERYRETLVKTIQQKKRDGEATAEEEAKLKKLEKQLKDLKFEQDNFNMSHEKMDSLLKKPKDAESIEELKAAIKRAEGELRRMEQSLGKNNKRYKEMASDVKDAKIELGKMEQQSKATASSFEKAWSRLKTYVGLYVGAAVAMQKIVATMGDLMELSDKMGEVRKTTKFTADEVGRLTTNLAKIETRSTLVQLEELAATAGQLGLKTEQDVRGFTEAANMLMVALPEMGKEGATAMLKVALATGEIDKIRQQMQDGLVEGNDAVSVAMTKIGSTIDSLRANSAAAAPAITDFVKRVGAVGAQSGITIDQVAALGSTVDALGMRVEMSATALSRMIPAIRNNAFEIAKAIGVTPETIRSLFDAGRGMEAILMILQHIKDSGADSEGIEQMLGMGGMADIMKDLNQQGARAGIVFAGLSQNVDELRRQLGVARNAYADNIAIQEEYNKMNDTTAAKWERLKNKIEETFVGDRGQSSLGWIIDKLRWIVDLLTGDNGVSAAIRSVILAITMLRVNIAGGLTGAIKKLYTTIKKMSWVGWANLITSVGLAVWYLGEQLGWFGGKTNAASTAVGNLEKQLKEESTRLEQTFRAFSKYNAELDSAKKNLEELAAANKDTAEAETALQKAQEKHDASIREINSKYGQYLGYMLSETASAVQLAKARELINSKLRETITLKQKEAALGDVEQEYGSKVRKAATNTDKLVQQYFGGNYDAAARVSVAISEAAEKYAKDSEGFNEALEKAIKAERKFLDPKQIAKIRSMAATGGVSLSDDDILKNISHNLTQRAQGLREAVGTYNKQVETTERIFDARANVQQKKTKQATIANLNAIKKDWEKALGDYQKASGEERAKLAVEVYKQQRAYATLFNNNKDYFDGDKQGGVIQRSIDRMKTYEDGLRKIAKEGIKAVDAAERAESIIQGTDFASGGGGEKNPWGGSHSGESIDWKNMTAEQLVTRRKQMKDFVNAIQTDTDVQSVLNEDAALKKAIEQGMSSDMRTVIEWYNTERLKIQEELHARHLTNTGDWMDPKKKSSRKKQLTDEWKAYLDELDAYYTERKAAIQQAQTDEGLSEADAQRRIVENEQMWRERRMELQKLYANKSAEVTKEEQQAIFDIIAGRTGDTASFIEKSIGKTVNFALKIREKSEKEYRDYMSKLDKGVEQDYLKQQNALAKQLNAIRDIIAKERPYDGITDNLHKNLDTMGILFAELDKKRKEALAAGKEPEDDSALRGIDEQTKRLSVLLKAAENAYELAWEDLAERLAKEGLKELADTIAGDDQMQQALMAQLHSTYDDIQNAIKKEASLIKKQVDIWWADIAPGADQSRKDTFERELSQMGLLEDSVKRANSLIGAGSASERVADKLAIKQMQIRLAMQATYYNKMRQIGEQRIAQLEAAGEMEDAEHLRKSMNLALTQEQVKLDEQRVAIANKLEESQNRLYTSLKEWSDLFVSGIQSIMEASNAGNAEYYDELAKMNLTGNGGPGAGTYVVIDNAGTSEATAHYEYLSEREALDRQREIEQQNAQAEAWKKVWDDINAKMDEQITDWINASLQNTAIDANTDALSANTSAIIAMTEAVSKKSEGKSLSSSMPPTISDGDPESFKRYAEWKAANPEPPSEMPPAISDADPESFNRYAKWKEAHDAYTAGVLENQKDLQQGEAKTDAAIANSAQSMFAKMTMAANMYGIAYQAMANENLTTEQKMQMMAVQAAGQSAISALTATISETTAETTARTPSVFAWLWSKLGWGAIPVFALFTGGLGALMAMATSAITKSKSQISQATGASSVTAGRLSTGMLTYAEGNVNEFTDPGSLREGRSYNVDAADGRTYRARYMGRNPKTHITNGPEFHLAGERGREMIINAGTTHEIVYNEPAVMKAIKMLSGGGRLQHMSAMRRGRGMTAFADGNVGDIAEMDNGQLTLENGQLALDNGQLANMQASIDRQNELLADLQKNGIKAYFDTYGKGGLIDSYDSGKKTVQRYGQPY